MIKPLELIEGETNVYALTEAVVSNDQYCTFLAPVPREKISEFQEKGFDLSYFQNLRPVPQDTDVNMALLSFRQLTEQLPPDQVVAVVRINRTLYDNAKNRTDTLGGFVPYTQEFSGYEEDIKRLFVRPLDIHGIADQVRDNFTPSPYVNPRDRIDELAQAEAFYKNR